MSLWISNSLAGGEWYFEVRTFSADKFRSSSAYESDERKRRVRDRKYGKARARRVFRRFRYFSRRSARSAFVPLSADRARPIATRTWRCRYRPAPSLQPPVARKQSFVIRDAPQRPVVNCASVARRFSADITPAKDDSRGPTHRCPSFD